MIRPMMNENGKTKSTSMLLGIPSLSIHHAGRPHYPAVGPLPNDRLSALPGVDNTWSMIKKFDPVPLELTPKGRYDIYGYVSVVVAAGMGHFVDRDVWEQVCLFAGSNPQTRMCVTQQSPKPFAHPRASAACPAVAVELSVPMASPPPPTSAPAADSVRLRPPGPPPLPVPNAPQKPVYNWSQLAKGSGPAPVLTGHVADPRGASASALAEPRAVD